MQIIRSVKNPPIGGDTAVALGLFDGVHIGHRAVLSVAASCRAQGLAPAAFSFSTRHTAPPGKAAGRIYSDGQRARLLLSCGMELALVPPFEEFSGMSGAAFAALLCEKLRARVVCCGEDYRFSKGAAAGAPQLAALCAAYGTRVLIVPPVEQGGERVSATRIRALLARGDVSSAGELLGRPYFMDSAIQTGRKNGPPTIRQAFPAGAMVPFYGVYAAFAAVGGGNYPAVTYIGVCPTVGGHAAPRAETHMMGFSGELNGRAVLVELLGLLRAEREFDSIGALEAQIARDCAAAREACRVAMPDPIR